MAARAGSGFLMRLVVDLNRCQAYAQCVFLAPEVFALHGDEGLLFSPRFDEGLRDRVEQAVAACPVQAILVDCSDEPTRGVQPRVG
jgi:ferredoxin